MNLYVILNPRIASNGKALPFPTVFFTPNTLWETNIVSAFTSITDLFNEKTPFLVCGQTYKFH